MTRPIKRRIEPLVLYIDDNPEGIESTLRKVSRRLQVLDVGRQDWNEAFRTFVSRADIVVSDFKFERDGAHNDQRLPPDGQVMNETVRALRRENPPIVAIYSAKLDEIPGTCGTDELPQQLARAFNAAFVGDKGKPKIFTNRLRSMISAVRNIQRVAGANRPLTEEQITRLLKLPKEASWRDDAIRALDLSRLPVRHEGGTAMTSMADTVNWFVRDVLPYPGVFVDTMNLAVMLRVQPKWLERKLDDDPELLTRPPFAVARFRGLLSDFYGRCWWTAGIDHVLWKTSGGVRDAETLNKLMHKWLGRIVKRLDHRSPVIEVNEFGVPTGEVIEASDAVRIMPVGWPAGGPWPWMAREAVKNDPVSKALALPDDLRSAGLN